MYSSLHLFQYSITNFPQGWERSAPGSWWQDQLAILPTVQAETAHSNKIHSVHSTSYHSKPCSQKCTLTVAPYITKFVPGLHNLIRPDITGIILGCLTFQWIIGTVHHTKQQDTENQTKPKSYNIRSVLQTKDGSSNSPSVRHTHAV